MASLQFCILGSDYFSNEAYEGYMQISKYAHIGVWVAAYNIRKGIKATRLKFLENQGITSLKGSPVPSDQQSFAGLSCMLNVFQEEF